MTGRPPMNPLNERLLRVAQCGFVTLDDPHVIADAQAEIDRLLVVAKRMEKQISDALRRRGMVMMVDTEGNYTIDFPTVIRGQFD